MGYLEKGLMLRCRRTTESYAFVIRATCDKFVQSTCLAFKITVKRKKLFSYPKNQETFLKVSLCTVEEVETV